MKGISPIIATILLIVMTVAIAGLLYAWFTGLFSSLTSSAGSQASKLTQLVSFYVSDVYYSGTSNISAIIYNNGNVPISTSPSSFSILAQEYYFANNTFDGNVYTCNISSGPSVIAPGSQTTVQLSCTSNTAIINGVNSGSYYYVFQFSYGGITETAQLT